MLELKSIKKDYITGDMTVHALSGIDITFRRNEFVSILGPSGCGKTTMLNIIGGLDQYTSGDLVLNGRSTKEFSAYDWDTYRNKNIGFVFQSYNLIPHLTVLGNVELALTLSGKSKAERREKAKNALIEVGLKDQINKRPNQLSGGQMQRVAIARAIVNNPDIILADEPTGALDSVTSKQVADLLKEISKDRLIIMVTHNDELAAKYSTRIIRLMDGLKVSDSNPFCPDETEKAAEIKAEKQRKNEYHAQSDITLIKKSEYDALTKKQQRAYAKQQKKQKKAREKVTHSARKKTSMKFSTAMSLSGRNLVTKKGRSLLVSFAGSIGIIGIALVLSISNGFSIYINKLQTDTLAGFPVTIKQSAGNPADFMNMSTSSDKEKYPDDGQVTVSEPDYEKLSHKNKIDEKYTEYISKIDKTLYNDIQYSYSSQFSVITKNKDNNTILVGRSIGEGKNSISIMGELMPNSDFVEEQYKILAGHYPTNVNEIVLIVDKYNSVYKVILDALGINYKAGDKINFDDLIGKPYQAVSASDTFVYEDANAVNKKIVPISSYSNLYDKENNVPLTISGILRVKPEAPIELFSSGLYYTPELTQFMMGKAMDSWVGTTVIEDTIYSYKSGKTYAQIIADDKGLTGDAKFLHMQDMQYYGVTKVPSSIYIYPKNFDTKEQINAYLDAYNVGKEEKDMVIYTDASQILTSTMGNMVDIISYVLVAFAGVSLVVSSIMIGIITYVSVIERTKEIGVLRSIGARKKDISRVFNAETILIGLAAGVFGVVISFVLTFPINVIINAVIASSGAGSMMVGNLAILNPIHGIVLIAVSVVLTLISGIIPSRIAAKKDPVVALRSE